MTPTLTVDGPEARIDFDGFDQEAYELFLRAKKLPEKRIAFDHSTDTYTLTTPARFAALLDPSLKLATAVAPIPIAGHLFDYQRWIVERALAARRFACWADTGLGKTAIFEEWGRQVANEGGVLILSPKQVVSQTVEMAQEFYGDSLPIERLDSRADLNAWCGSPGIGISNTEKFAKDPPDRLRFLHGLVLDESSILKTGGGVIKWNLIHGAKGIPYKLSCTATPAPNDTMEYASQAGFLEVLRHEGEILWTYFSRDKRGVWSVKPHAREAFYSFMASWSIYLRDPAAYGFKPILDSLPKPEYHEHRIEITEAQRSEMHEILAGEGKGLFDTNLGIRERAKLAQIARGFIYEQGEPRAIESSKPDVVAGLVAREAIDNERPTIVWTNFDEESRILAEKIREAIGERHLEVAELSGSTPDKWREQIIDSFRSDKGVEVLISKPQLIGYGLNFQRCKAMVFSGLDDSFERRYQAVRRAYRLGQTDPVQVHLPHVPELEGHLLANVAEKEARFESEIAAMESNFVEALA